MPVPPENKKKLLLHSWRSLDYKSHIECTSPSRSQIQYIYVHFHLVNESLSGISFRKWNHQHWGHNFYDLPFEIVFVILKWHLNRVCWRDVYILEYFR
jgi:hypothetical protein